MLGALITSSRGPANRRVVLVDDRKLRELPALPEENLLTVGPFPPIFWEPGTYMVYLCESPEAKDRVSKLFTEPGPVGTIQPPLFPPPQTFQSKISPISSIWGRGKRWEGWRGVVAALRVIVPQRILANREETKITYHATPLNNGELYIDMMSVRPQFQRNRVNAALIRAAMTHFKATRISTSPLTHAGDGLIKWFTKEFGKKAFINSREKP